MNKASLVKDIMTREVITAFLETPLIEIAGQIIKNGYSGIPVVDKDKKLIGIVTDYDFLSKVHLPAFIEIFSEIPGPENNPTVRGKLKEIISFTASDIVNTEPFIVHEDATVGEVVTAFSEHHRINPIPVINSFGVLVGIVSRYDIIKFYAAYLKQ